MLLLFSVLIMRMYVLLDARRDAITVSVVIPDGSFYFAAVICVVENLVESGVV